MKSFHDGLLTTVARASNRLGPVTKLIDGIVDHLVPKTTVLAATTPCNSNYTYFCGASCVHDSSCAEADKSLYLVHWGTNNDFNSNYDNPCGEGAILTCNYGCSFC